MELEEACSVGEHCFYFEILEFGGKEHLKHGRTPYFFSTFGFTCSVTPHWVFTLLKRGGGVSWYSLLMML